MILLVSLHQKSSKICILLGAKKLSTLKEQFNYTNSFGSLTDKKPSINRRKGSHSLLYEKKGKVED